MPRRHFKGMAAKTRLTGNIGAGDTSFSIETATGWPTGGANGPFYVTLDPDSATEERVLVGTQSGGSCTSVTRGVDDTSAVAHNIGLVGSVIHSSAAVDYDEANKHIYVTTDDNHTQYMKTDGTRHDLRARHTFSVIGWTPGTPTAVVANQAAAQGAGVDPARDTHTHAGPITAVPVSVGTALSAGSGTSLALANHVHDIGDAAADALLPTGIIVPYGGTADIGTAWLLCDGRAISRTTFSTLFGVLGTAFGAGDGSTTFNIPDLRGRFPLGKATAGTGSTRGGTGGALDHTHSLANDDAHAHWTAAAVGGNNRWIRRINVPSWTPTHTAADAPLAGSATPNTTAASLGGSTDIANAPYQVTNYLIRT